ncbi:MAG: tyrosine-type recombinase/integrase [Actinomycetota bacterium]|nr:tyrosine-type recombinase/integrase [Actinomycetota bacterium]
MADPEHVTAADIEVRTPWVAPAKWDAAVEPETAALVARDADRDAEQVVEAWVRKGSELTQRTKRSSLASIARVLGDDIAPEHVLWHRVGPAEAGVLRFEIAARYTPSTARKLVSALRGVIRQAWVLGLLDGETKDRALVELEETIRGSRLPKGRQVPIGEIRAIFEAAATDQTPAGRRDAAILALLMAGLRRSEVAGVLVEQLDREAWTLRVIGKGNKERLVHLAPGSIEALRAYLELRGDVPGPIVQQVTRRSRRRDSGGRLRPGTGITGQTVENVLSDLCERAHVPDIDPHDLRRTLISTMLNDTDIATVASLVGHASVTTTQRYDRRPDRARRDAMARQLVPYVSPTRAARSEG